MSPEGLNQIDTVVFDKTGTLTEGRLTLSAVHPLGELDADSCLALAAALENRSEHPIARAFGRAPLAAESVETVPGLGLQGGVQGRNLRIGQPGFVAEGFAGSAPAIPGEHGQWLLLGDEQVRWPGWYSTTGYATTPRLCWKPAADAAGGHFCFPETARRWWRRSPATWALTRPKVA